MIQQKPVPIEAFMSMLKQMPPNGEHIKQFLMNAITLGALIFMARHLDLVPKGKTYDPIYKHVVF